MSASPEPDLLSVSVRALCEFAAREGDLDLRFTPAPTALEGMSGHAEVGSRRPSGYERELRLEGRYRQLQVRGRADGYDPARNRLEEIKTHRRGDAAVPLNQLALHWAQARVYGWLLCEARGLVALELALVYYDIGSQRETLVQEHQTAAALKAIFEGLCDRFLAWARDEIRHRGERDLALGELAFPHGAFREGQRRLAEAVYRANAAGRCLLAQAPTGIGKTIGTLFPALKAMPGQKLDKVFYLTAKTPGRQLALDSLRALREQVASPPLREQGVPPPLRVLELVARDKACEHPDKACHGESCPLAAGFYDRLPQARVAAAAAGWLDRSALREIAAAHSVCPYYLAQEMSRWSDVVVGDYNHFFDLGALLHGLTQQEGWRVSLLVDEAHNLVDRARAIYTAELRLAELRAVKRTAAVELRRPLGALERQLKARAMSQEEAYRVEDELPVELATAVRKAGAALGAHFSECPAHGDSDLLHWYFELLRFESIAELQGAHSMCDFRIATPPGGRVPSGLQRAWGAESSARAQASKPAGPADIAVCIRNVLPAPLLAERWAVAHSATLFSATLAPVAHYLEMLGLPETTVSIDVASPFQDGQLAVRVVRKVSTRYRDRGRTLDAVVAIMGQQYERQPGNYLAFFSSFEYLQSAADRLAQLYPEIGICLQSPGMPETEREAFLARFTPQSRGIGFAVLGGAFGEGIDLPGTRLIGAFIASLGLPQLNAVNEQLRKRIEACLGRGYEHTYLYPGLRKVVQAAGRVVRAPDDRGLVYLMDDRYAHREVAQLLPQWWSIEES
jgi:DNA excision repair protein ERCC-2